MDFKTVLGLITKGFQKEGVRYGLMGGFALGALGVVRSTVDLDFLVLREDLAKVDKIMKDNGYECVYKSDEVSQYVSPVKIFGEVDFIHAFRKVSCSMLERAVEKDVFGGEFTVKILKAEDIIGLKLQAVANDENRTTREYADIEALMDYYRVNLDWNFIKEYFKIFNQDAKFTELKERFFNVK